MIGIIQDLSLLLFLEHFFCLRRLRSLMGFMFFTLWKFLSLPPGWKSVGFSPGWENRTDIFSQQLRRWLLLTDQYSLPMDNGHCIPSQDYISWFTRIVATDWVPKLSVWCHCAAYPPSVQQRNEKQDMNSEYCNHETEARPQTAQSTSARVACHTNRGCGLARRHTCKLWKSCHALLVHMCGLLLAVAFCCC